MSESCGAVLILGFGGPPAQEHVRPFIENVVRGRSVISTRIDEVVRQYDAIGGKSPFNELTLRQAKALEHCLASKGKTSKVYVGMLNWEPYIEQAVREMVKDGVKHAVVLILAPHRCEASFDRYVLRLNVAKDQEQAHDLAVDFVDQWHAEDLFIEAISDRVKTAMVQLSKDERACLKLIFTAHSVPKEMSGSLSYKDQIGETARLVADKCSVPDWQVAFQSRSGSPTQPWLEPDVRDAIKDARNMGYQSVIIVPIGFVSDHVEVLYDLDIQASAVANDVGIKMVRAKTVGNHALFVQMLAEIVLTRMQNQNLAAAL
jgi:ferrochelatase